MPFSCHHLDKFEFINLDLVQEVLSRKKKCIVLIGGASSSGKSFCAKQLYKVFRENNLKTLCLSSDNYNKGISGIITDKVNSKDFNNTLPREELVHAIRPILFETPFENKFDNACCKKIRVALKNILPDEKTIDRFLACCQREIKSLNFDEPDVYDLNKVANDLNALLKNQRIRKRTYSKVESEPSYSKARIDGAKYQVIILEGIYVLSDSLVKRLNKNATIKNFILGSPKSLFLRRVIRDAMITSAPSYYTINMYFNNIVPSYNSTILPSSKNADVLFSNEMTFAELREGTLYKTKDKVKITNPLFLQEFLSNAKIVDTFYQRDFYFKGINEPHDDNNLLRMREISVNQGKDYHPTSLIHKGAPKARRDGKEIRPINILLKEGEFDKSFKGEKDFLEKMKEASFCVDKVCTKIKRHLVYQGYKFTISDFKNEAIWLEFSDSKLPERLHKKIKEEASK